MPRQCPRLASHHCVIRRDWAVQGGRHIGLQAHWRGVRFGGRVAGPMAAYDSADSREIQLNRRKRPLALAIAPQIFLVTH